MITAYIYRLLYRYKSELLFILLMILAFLGYGLRIKSKLLIAEKHKIKIKDYKNAQNILEDLYAIEKRINRFDNTDIAGWLRNNKEWIAN